MGALHRACDQQLGGHAQDCEDTCPRQPDCPSRAGSCVCVVTTTIRPAAGTTLKTMLFAGSVSVVGGSLGYPCTPNNGEQCPPSPTLTTKPGPKGVPSVNIVTGGNHANFAFASDVCLKTSVSTPDKPGGKKGFAEPCNFSGVGVIWGFCGMAQGQGTATLVNLAGSKGTSNIIDIDFKFTWLQGALHMTGGDSTRLLVGWRGSIRR